MLSQVTHAPPSGGSFPGNMLAVYISSSSPDSTVAFEAAAKGNLPHPVPPCHAPGALYVGQYIPAHMHPLSHACDAHLLVRTISNRLAAAIQAALQARHDSLLAKPIHLQHK